MALAPPICHPGKDERIERDTSERKKEGGEDRESERKKVRGRERKEEGE